MPSLVKAAVTRWLSHRAACKHCQERYHIIIEALHDIITTSRNPELAACRDFLTFRNDNCLSTNIPRRYAKHCQYYGTVTAF